MKTWIAPFDAKKTKNMLMLDLEQVLFVDSGLLLRREFWKKEDKQFYDDCCQIRNYSQEFVREIDSLFDKVYLNTGVPEDKANKIMKDFFDVEFSYHCSGSSLKSAAYETASKEMQLFHLEDEILSPQLVEDANNMKKLGVHIFSIEPYNSHQDDVGNLKDVLEEMKKYLV